MSASEANEAASAVTRLVMVCPDKPGIVAAVAGFLSEAGANITHSDQHSTDPSGGSFSMRMEFRLELELKQRAEFERRFEERVAGPLSMRWRVSYPGQSKRIAVLATHEDHCLLDLLWRWRRGELEGDIVLVISNHEHLRPDVESFGVPYRYVPVEKDAKSDAEARLLELLRGNVDLAVLARYMQILSGRFLEAVGIPLINIHHSFLPSFPGAAPYARAKARGVKLIGATAHYVTEDLDAGPIIEQDVIRVSHREDTAALARLGRDIERTVLARAVTWHCQDRVLVHNNTTVVF